MLIISYSGIRGTVGDSLTPEVARAYGVGFLRLLGKTRPRIVLARDTRPSGPALLRGMTEGLAGAELVDLGVAATPTLQHCMRPLAADGAVCITASHNPSSYNGMKFFVGPDNTVLDGAQTASLVRLATATEPCPLEALPVPQNAREQAQRLHVDAVLANVDGPDIRRSRFRVALDAASGAGEPAMSALLRALGCTVVPVTSQRESEPVPESLGALAEAVHRERCALGLALDLDGDRLALVTERGEIPGEQRTLVLVVAHLLRRFPHGRRAVVRNVVTTRAVDDVVRAAGAEVIETRVGEIHLSRALAALGRDGVTAFGGEGNGGVIFPPVSLGRDSLVGAAFVLEALAGDEAPLSVRLRALPEYAIAKAVRPAGADLERLYAAVVARFPEAQPARLDGLTLCFADGAWIGVRPSNTEPVVRVVAESRSASWAAEVVAQIGAL